MATHEPSDGTWDAIEAVVAFECQRCHKWVSVNALEEVSDAWSG